MGMKFNMKSDFDVKEKEAYMYKQITDDSSVDYTGALCSV